MSETPDTEQLAKQRREYADYSDALTNPERNGSDRFGIRARYREEQDHKKKEDQYRLKQALQLREFMEALSKAMDEYRNLQVLLHDAMVEAGKAVSASKKELDDVLDNAATLASTGEKVFKDKDGGGFTADGRALTKEEMDTVNWSPVHSGYESFLDVKARHIANTERQDHLISVNDRVEELGERLEDQDNLTLEEVELIQAELMGVKETLEPKAYMAPSMEVSSNFKGSVPDLKF